MGELAFGAESVADGMDHKELVAWQILAEVEAEERSGTTGREVVRDPHEISRWFAETA